MKFMGIAAMCVIGALSVAILRAAMSRWVVSDDDKYGSVSPDWQQTVGTRYDHNGQRY